jgi:hypothetical protein
MMTNIKREDVVKRFNVEYKNGMENKNIITWAMSVRYHLSAVPCVNNKKRGYTDVRNSFS